MEDRQSGGLPLGEIQTVSDPVGRKLLQEPLCLGPRRRRAGILAGDRGPVFGGARSERAALDAAAERAEQPIEDTRARSPRPVRR